MKLARERGAEVENLGRGWWRVPGCSGGPYRVHLAILGGEQSCECPDFTEPRRGRADGEPCKHVYAATVVRARRQAKARREERRNKARVALAGLERMGA